MAAHAGRGQTDLEWLYSFLSESTRSGVLSTCSFSARDGDTLGFSILSPPSVQCLRPVREMVRWHRLRCLQHVDDTQLHSISSDWDGMIDQLIQCVLGSGLGCREGSCSSIQWWPICCRVFLPGSSLGVYSEIYPGFQLISRWYLVLMYEILNGLNPGYLRENLSPQTHTTASTTRDVQTNDLLT